MELLEIITLLIKGAALMAFICLAFYIVAIILYCSILFIFGFFSVIFICIVWIFTELSSIWNRNKSSNARKWTGNTWI